MRATALRDSTVRLHPTKCAICETEDNAATVFAATFRPDDFNPTVFSARRSPDRLHYRMVRCRSCGLIRSDPAAVQEALGQLYGSSCQSYDQEVPSLRRTYGAYLRKVIEMGAKRERLLDVGCGSGFMLEEAQRIGYSSVRGVEPSAEAIGKAPESIRSRIVNTMMEPGLFDAGSFDVICMFHVLDHVVDPNDLLAECRRLLAPGGFVLCIAHNVEALSARVLGERSPIVDIEHTFLYSLRTVQTLFSKHGFSVRGVGGMRNSYSLGYLLKLLPVSAQVKAGLAEVLHAFGLEQMVLSLPLGNLYLIAQEPPAGTLAGV